MMKQGELLRIGELAKEAGVSLTTVKFYAKEGLIRPARKTGRNMAYYDRACVNTIGTIRRLQRERYYPLSVIKRPWNRWISTCSTPSTNPTRLTRASACRLPRPRAAAG